MRMKAIAAMVIPLVLAGATVALAQSESVVFQINTEFTCPGTDMCSEQVIYDGEGKPIYEEYIESICYCDWYHYIDDFDADAIGVLQQFRSDKGYIGVSTDIERPLSATMWSVVPGQQDELFKLCAGHGDTCTQWCEGECIEISQFYQYIYPEYWPPRVNVQVTNFNADTVTVSISATVVALRIQQSQPGVLPQLNPEYFNPFPYQRDAPSPLRGIRIDFTFVARSIVTVMNMLSEGGYLTWIAAFAVIFIILLSFINYILKRIGSGGGG